MSELILDTNAMDAVVMEDKSVRIQTYYISMRSSWAEMLLLWGSLFLEVISPLVSKNSHRTRTLGKNVMFSVISSTSSHQRSVERYL